MTIMTVEREEIDRLEAELAAALDRAETAEESTAAVAVCQKHISDIIGYGCLVCQLAEARAREEALRAVIEAKWDETDWRGEYGLGDEPEKQAIEIVSKYHHKWDLIWAVAFALRQALAAAKEQDEPPECDPNCDDPDCPYTH